MTGMQYLPEIDNKPIQTRCFRYSGNLTSAPNPSFDTQDIRCAVGFVTSASTTYYPVIDAFKLNRIGVTILPNSTTSAGTVTFSWVGINQPDIRETLLFTNAIPVHASFYPYEGSSASFWWDNTSTLTELFSLRSTETDISVILDIQLEYIINTGAITSVALSGASSFTGVGYRTLPIGNNSFTPVDLDVVT